jgi:hypothetical protein
MMILDGLDEYFSIQRNTQRHKQKRKKRIIQTQFMV